MRFLFGNIAYKVTALCIAFVLWAAAQGFRSVDLSVDLPVALEDVPEDVVVVGQSVSEINVKLSGSRAALRRVREAPPRYAISLAAARPPGLKHTVDTFRLALPRGAEVMARAPGTISIEIDPVVEKRVRVRADVVGEPPEGYRVASISVVPSHVMLAGARRSIRMLREVMTDRIELGDLRESVVLDVPLVLGVSHTWRAGEEASPIRVEVRIDPPESEETGARGEEAGQESLPADGAT